MSSIRDPSDVDSTVYPPSVTAGWPAATTVPVSSTGELKALLQSSAQQSGAQRLGVDDLGQLDPATRATIRLLQRMVWGLMVSLALLIILVGVASATLIRVGEVATDAVSVVGEGVGPSEVSQIMQNLARASGDVSGTTQLAKTAMQGVHGAVSQASSTLNETTAALHSLALIMESLASSGTLTLGVGGRR